MADEAYAAAARDVYAGSIHGVVSKSHPDLAARPELLDRLHSDLSDEGLVWEPLRTVLSISDLSRSGPMRPLSSTTYRVQARPTCRGPGSPIAMTFPGSQTSNIDGYACPCGPDCSVSHARRQLSYLERPRSWHRRGPPQI